MNGEVIEDLEGVSWEFFPSDPVPPGSRLRAIVRARLLDEITRIPVTSGSRIQSSRKDLVPRVASDGLVGLSGTPSLAFPGLATTGVKLDLSITNPGYLPMQLNSTLAAIATFPQAFAPLDFGDVMLHRAAVAIHGRVVKRAQLAPPPLAGATVKLDLMWSNPPPPNWTAPAFGEAPRIASTSPGLYVARPVNTTATQCALAPAGPSKALLDIVDPGATRIRLSDRDGLAVNDVLLIDTGGPERTEAILITAIEPTLAVDLPSWITLAYPAVCRHRSGAVCARAAATAGVASAKLTRGAIPGDRVIFTDSLPAFTDGAYVKIDDGANPPEFQIVRLFSAVTDAGGYFRLPPLSRVALVGLSVTSGALTPGKPILTLAYPSPIQQITVLLE